MLLLTLFFSNRNGVRNDEEAKIINKLILFGLLSCISDPLLCIFDGKPGTFNYLGLFIGNSWLYLSNVLTGYLFARFLAVHLRYPLSEIRERIYSLLIKGAVIALIVNFFLPFIFSLENNTYERKFAYWIFIGTAFFYIIDSLVIYYQCRSKAGTLKFFPVAIFVAPIAFGLIIQSMYYGITVIWPSIAVSIAGVVTATKNEIIYTDNLTGLYNRVYLDFIEKQYYKKNDAVVTGIMCDINDFKNINDTYGHAVGDEALIEFARILKNNFGEYGSVMRYAGDEFVIIINSKDEELVKSLLQRTYNSLHSFNESRVQTYRLSASFGYAIIDLKETSMSDFMNTIDDKMYEAKLSHYKSVSRQYKKKI
ncbi:MAG: GGDEF domain-containing protein [Erysipelotrichaceae bacterium]|nr:GGDEF domain-containing protein [Erysipelotrichaceae bacterium]